MKIKAFWDGCASDAKEYIDTHPEVAAAKYAEASTKYGKNANRIVVEPIDDEAIAAHAWLVDEEGLFMVFYARPTISWTITAITT